MIITKAQLDAVGVQAAEALPNGDVKFIMADDRYYEAWLAADNTGNESIVNAVEAAAVLGLLIQTYITEVK